MGTLGDCFDRYIVRMREMQESCRILRQCLAQIPDGPVIAKVPRNFKPPAGDATCGVESARGDMGWYVVSDGTRVSVSLQDPHGLVRRDQHHRST